MNNFILESKEDKNKFANWIKDNTTRKFILDDDRDMFVNSLVNNFILLKPKIKSPYNDFYYWMKNSTPDDLQKYVDELLKQHREKSVLKDKEKEGAELVYSDDTWKVYHITNYEASAKYGKGTKWCITGTKRWNDGEDGKETFQEYHEKNHVEFYFFIKNGTEKYALALYPDGKAYEIFNAEDVSIAYIPDAPKVEGIPDVSKKNDLKILINAIASDNIDENIVFNAIEEPYVTGDDYSVFITQSPREVSEVMNEKIPDGYLEYNAVASGRMTPEEYEEITGDTISQQDIDNGYFWGGDLPEVQVDEDKFTTKAEVCDEKNYKGHKYWYFFTDLNDWARDELYWADDKVGLYNSLRQLLDYDDMYSFLETVATTILYNVKAGRVGDSDILNLGVSKEYIDNLKPLYEDANSSQQLYHGSGEKFSSFNKEINWLTNDYDYAKYYALSLRDEGYIYKCNTSLNNLFEIGATGYRVYEMFPVTRPFMVSERFLKAIKPLNLSSEEEKKLLDDVTREWNLEGNGYKMMCSTVARSNAFKKVLLSKGYKGIHALEYNVPKSRYCDTYGIFDGSSIEIEDVEKVSMNVKYKKESLNEEHYYHNFSFTDNDIKEVIKIDRQDGMHISNDFSEGPSILLRDGSVFNVSNYGGTHMMFAGSLVISLGYEVSAEDDDNLDEEALDYLEYDLGVITLNSGNHEYEDRTKIVVDTKPSEAQYKVLLEFLDTMLALNGPNSFVYVYARGQQQTYSLATYTSDDIVKKIRRAYAFGRLEEEILSEKNYKLPTKTYDFNADNSLTWDKDAEDYIYWGSEADKWAEDYAKSYKVQMSPKEFLDLTTQGGASSLKKGDNLGLGELRDLDKDEFNKWTHQPIYLNIAFRDENNPNKAQVVGHEGRHRMFALMQAGYNKIDVELHCEVWDTNFDKYHPFNAKYFDLIGQFNKSVLVRVYNPYPLSWKNHKSIRPELKDESLLEDLSDKDYLEELDKTFGQEEIYMWSTYVLPNGHFLNPDNAQEYFDTQEYSSPGYEHYDFEDYLTNKYGNKAFRVFEKYCMKMNVTYPYINIPTNRMTSEQYNSLRKIIDRADMFEPALGDCIDRLQSFTGKEYKGKYDIHSPLLITSDNDAKLYDLNVDDANTIIKDIQDYYRSGSFLRESLDKGGNTFIYKGKKAWSGAVDTLDGTIEEVHSYNEAKDYGFHHSFYFSDEQLEKMEEGLSCVFFVWNDHKIQVDAMCRFNPVDAGIKFDEKFLQDRIREQIKFIDNESLNEEKENDIIDFAMKNIGTSDKPVDGPSYIMPNGKFLTIWRSKIPVSKYSSSGSATHRDVQQYLYDNGLVKDDFWNVEDPDLERLGCIRVNSGFEEYIWLPDNRPNETQWQSLLVWLDWYFAFHKKITVGYYHYAPKTYFASEYTTDEILKKCKEAYARGYLTESKNNKWNYKQVANNIVSDLENIYDSEGIVAYNEVSIVDDWDEGCDIEATYYDDNERELAWLVVRVYQDNPRGITFRQTDVYSKDYYNDKDYVSLRGTGFAEELVKACLDNLDNDARVLVHMDLSGGFWYHMSQKYSQYDWDKSLHEKIVKKGSKWQVQSEKGKNLGTYDTKEEAEKRLKDVEMFKHMNEKIIQRGENEYNYSNNLENLAGKFFFGDNQYKKKDWPEEERDGDYGDLVDYNLSKDAKIYKGYSSEYYCDTHKLNDVKDKMLKQILINSGLKDEYVKKYENQDLTLREIRREDLPFKTRDVNSWFACFQYMAKKDLEKKGYDGAEWEHEDDVTPHQYQIWNLDKVKRVNKESLKEDLQEEDNEGNTLSKEQIEFFKNSKVRDNSGKLLVCYHFTNNEFDTFKYSKNAKNGRLNFGKAFYFTDIADDENVRGYGSIRKDCYLNLVNPLIVDARGTGVKETPKDFNGYVNGYVPEGDPAWHKEWYRYKEENNIIYQDYAYELYFHKAHKQGNDGIIIYNVADYSGSQSRSYSTLMTVFVAFEENQIKAITNKNPTSKKNINEDYKDDFINRTNQHIARVNKYAKKINKSYPNHDSDKFNELFDGYSLMNKKDVSEEEQKMIDDATYKHVINNEHHCEHWCNPKDVEGFSRSNPTPHGCLDCTKMPEEAMTEMCCDWCAMSEEFNNTPFEWFDKVKDTRWHFNEKQEKFILDTLHKLWEDKDLKESLKESTGFPITVYTYQKPQVRELLEKGETYIASYDRANYNHYKDLARVLGFNNCPIFGALSKEDLYDMLDSSGIDWEDENILHLEIPKENLRYTEYYDWTDYMYALDEPDEFKEESGLSIEDLENLLRTQKSASEYDNCQVVFDRIEPKWYQDGKDEEEALNEDLDIPQYLYHATYKPFLKSIKEKGLGNTRRKMWSDSKRGVVYLAKDKDVAYSYAENAEWLDDVEDYDKYADNIIVLKIDTSKLDKSKLFDDENVLDDDSTVEYHGVIPFDTVVEIIEESLKEDIDDEEDDDIEKDDYEDVLKDELDYLNKWLDKYGFEVKLVNDYKFNTNDVGMFLGDIQDNASIFPIALNKKYILKLCEKGGILLDDAIEGTLWHEAGHGIYRFLQDLYELDEDEEDVVEEFARYREDSYLFKVLQDYMKNY